MSRRLLAAVAAAALTFGLVACGNGGDGPVTTSPPKIDIGRGGDASDSGGDAPSDGGGAEADDGEGSTEAAPDIPAPDPADFPGMDEKTPEGAEQSFKYFWAVAISGYQGADASELSELSGDECKNCVEMLDEIRELAEGGDQWSRVQIEDVAVRSETGDESFDVIVDYTFVIPAHDEPGATGDEGSTVEEAEMETSGGLSWVDGRWKVLDYSAAPAEGDGT